MESTSSLSTESFSRSWLVGYNPSSDASPARENSCSTSFDAADEASFIEMDPKLSDSRRFYRVGKDFSFDFRARESPVILADADELITDGLLLPLSTAVDQLFKTETTTSNYYYNYADDEAEFSASPKLISSFSQKEANNSSNEVACASLRRCKSATKRIFNKYLEFIAPFCEKFRRRRSASRVSSMSSQFDHCSPAAAASSPATNPALSGNKYEYFVGVSECSISEAVLHCKRTNGMQCQPA